MHRGRWDGEDEPQRHGDAEENILNPNEKRGKQKSGVRRGNTEDKRQEVFWGLMIEEFSKNNQ